MINTMKNYFTNLGREGIIIGIVLLASLILAYIGGAGISSLAIGSLFIFSSILIYKKIEGPDGFVNTDKKMLIPVVLILITGFFSIFFAQNYFLAVKAFLILIAFFGVLFSAKNFSKNQVLISSVVLSVATFIFALYEYFIESGGGVVRLTGFVNYTNTLGLYAVIFGFLVLKQASEFKTKIKWFLFSIVAMDFFVAIMTLSRGVLVALIFSALVVLLIFRKKINLKRVSKDLVTSLLITAIIFAILVPIKKYINHQPVALNRGDSSLTETSNIRLKYFATALRMFKDNTFGVGPGNYREAVFSYEKSPVEHSSDPHSFVMSLLAEYGIFIIFWVYLLSKIIINVVKNRESLTADQVAYLFFGLVFFTHSLADSDMLRPLSWIILAFLVGNFLNFDNPVSGKDIKLATNISAGVLTVSGMLILISAIFLMNSYDTTGTYKELQAKDINVMTAARIVQIDATLWDNASQMAMAKAFVAKSDEDKQRSINELFYRVDRSIALKGDRASQHSLKARGYVLLRDEQNYRLSLEKAVSLAPFNTYSERLALASYYFNINKYDELKGLAFSTYEINKDYFGTVYAANDPEQGKKYTAMQNMLGMLQHKAKLNKDKETFNRTVQILQTLN